MSRINFGRAISLLLALLATTSLFQPSLASAAPSPATAVLDEEVSRKLATARDDERIHVLIESTGPTSPSRNLDENSRRAQRAGDAVRKSGGAVRGHLSLVGAVATELTPAQLRELQRDPNVSRITVDRPVRAAAADARDADGPTPITFKETIGADAASERGLTGRGVGVAVLDTGIAANPAFGSRVVERVDFVSRSHPSRGDLGGHGTHVAGIIAASSPAFKGVAPDARLVSVRVLDENGNGRVSTVIKGLEWTVVHGRRLGVRVAVLALSAPSIGSYVNDPLAAATELAWHAGVVVVASAGNGGPADGSVGSPGNDPFVITVGASDENLTGSTRDDVLAWFSGRGRTADGIAKPDVIAPGRKIVSLRVPGSTIDEDLPTHREPSGLFRLTGTSQAAAVAAGAVAVLLQQRADLTPNQVKELLKDGARAVKGASAAAQGSGELNLARSLALRTPSRREAAQRAQPATGFIRAVLPLLLRQRPWPNGSYWDTLSWDTLSWDTLSWDTLSWDTLSWDTLSWDALSWDALSWDALSWDVLSWDALSWDALSWDTGTPLD